MAHGLEIGNRNIYLRNAIDSLMQNGRPKETRCVGSVNTRKNIGQGEINFYMSKPTQTQKGTKKEKNGK